MTKQPKRTQWADLDDHQKLTFLCIAQFDMFQTLYAIALARDLARDVADPQNDTRFTVASDMAAIRYARSFKRSVVRNGALCASLPQAPILSCLSEAERTLHTRVVALRDSGAAHGDHNIRNVHVELFSDPADGGRLKVRSLVDHDCLGMAELSLLCDALLKILQQVEEGITALVHSLRLPEQMRVGEKFLL